MKLFHTYKFRIAVLLPIIAILLPYATAINALADDIIPPVNWHVADTLYDTDTYIIVGYEGVDFGIFPNTGEDVTKKIQSALNALFNLGGGSLFLPSGQYTIKGTLTIPYGVSLVGDWKNPENNNKATAGTTLLAYSGRGDEEGTPFISMKPSSQLRGLNIFYPEQSANNILAYPPTVCMYAPLTWGADYVEVRDMTFVNSYTAIKQGPVMNNCPTIKNIYATPIHTALTLDGITDVGRFSNIHISPDYWIHSNLGNAQNYEEELRSYIKNNACGIVLARIDWSYLTYSSVSGCKYGITFQLSECDDSYTNGKMTSYTYPNGHCYSIDISQCDVGIYSYGCSGAGELIYDLNIKDCNIGIETVLSKNSSDGNMQISASSIQGGSYSVKSTGDYRICISDTLLLGDVYASSGELSMSGCTYTGSVLLQPGVHQAMIASPVSVPTINNIGGVPLLYSVDSMTFPKIYNIEKEVSAQTKPYKKDIYVVTDAPYSAQKNDVGFQSVNSPSDDDASPAIQQALIDAEKNGGGIVFCPPGRYLINTPLTIPTGVQLSGAINHSRIPVKLGTIFDTPYTTSFENTAWTYLSSGSGISGITYNIKDNPYLSAPLPSPYMISGIGANIYVLNISLRNVYNGLNFSDCDNHYIDGTAGIAWNNEITVSNSRNGIIANSQFNRGSLLYGFQEKYGIWEDSPTGEERTEAENAMNSYMSENLSCFEIENCTNQILYNNFSFFGAKSLVISGTTTGISIGHGADASRNGICLENSSSMSFINSQIVSFYYPVSSHITAEDSFSGNADFVNVSAWSSPASNICSRGGVINIFNPTFNGCGKTGVVDCDKGEVSISCGFLRNSTSLNIGNVKARYKNMIFSSRLYPNAENVVSALCSAVRFGNVEPKYSKGSPLSTVFNEGFTSYPINVEKNTLASTASFSEVGLPSEGSAVSIDGENEWMSFLSCSGSNQAYAYNHSLTLQSGTAHSSYMMETRLRVDSIKTGGAFDMILSNLNSSWKRDGLFSLSFNSNCEISFSNYAKKIPFVLGEWYIIYAKIDLRDINNKNIVLSVYSDDGEKVGETDVIPLANQFQGNLYPIGDLLIRATSSNADADDSKTQAYIDYITIDNEKKLSSQPYIDVDLLNNRIIIYSYPNFIKESIGLLAIYSKSGKLTYVDTQAIASSQMIFENIPLNPDDNYWIKFMIWDSVNTYVPKEHPMQMLRYK